MKHKVKNIILIRPPFNSRDEKAVTRVDTVIPFFPPNGIALISSVLKKYGYDVVIKDMYESPWQEIEAYFKDKTYDMVGITCVSGSHFNCLKLAKIAKEKIYPTPIVVLGGPHPSAAGIDTQIIFNYPQVDFIVRGEGENTIVELLSMLNGSGDVMEVKGLALRYDGKAVRTGDREQIDDLDALPFADYSFFDFNNKQMAIVPIMSSRGCPNKCKFCDTFLGKEVRFRSPENVVREIEELYKKRGVFRFAFGDDCFNASLARAEKICQLIIERRLPITWTAMARVRPLSENFLSLAKKAGCASLNFGIESGSEKILKSAGKNIAVEDIIRAFELIKKAGINATALLMVGLPGETLKSINESIALIDKIRPAHIEVAPTVILPNSELHSLSLKQGIIDQEYWLKNENSPYYTAEHSADELRYFRFKILFYYCLFKKDISMITKLGILICSYRFIKLFKLEINQVRDVLFEIPLIRSVLKKFKTA